MEESKYEGARDVSTAAVLTPAPRRKKRLDDRHSSPTADTNLDLSIVRRDTATATAAGATYRDSHLAEAADGISGVGTKYSDTPVGNHLSHLDEYEIKHVAAASAATAVTLEGNLADDGEDEEEEEKKGKEQEQNQEQEVAMWRRQRVRHSSTLNTSKDSRHRPLVGTSDTPATTAAAAAEATVPGQGHDYRTAGGAAIDDDISGKYLRGRYLGDRGEGDEVELEVREEGGTYVSAGGSSGDTDPLVPGFCPLAPFERYAQMQGDIMEARAEQRWGGNTP